MVDVSAFDEGPLRAASAPTPTRSPWTTSPTPTCRGRDGCGSDWSRPATPTSSARCACCRVCRSRWSRPGRCARQPFRRPGVRPIRAERATGGAGAAHPPAQCKLARARQRRSDRHAVDALGRLASAADRGVAARRAGGPGHAAQAGDGRASRLARRGRAGPGRRASHPGGARGPQARAGQLRARGVQLCAAGELSGLSVQRHRLADPRAACAYRPGRAW